MSNDQPGKRNPGRRGERSLIDEASCRVQSEPKLKRSRMLEKQNSDEPGLMAEASRRVVCADDIQSGALLHVLALENLEGFQKLEGDKGNNPLVLGQRDIQEELVLSWASACSGSEGIYYVMEALNATFTHVGVKVRLQHAFSCESILVSRFHLRSPRLVRCARPFCQ